MQVEERHSRDTHCRNYCGQSVTVALVMEYSLLPVAEVEPRVEDNSRPIQCKLPGNGHSTLSLPCSDAEQPHHYSYPFPGMSAYFLMASVYFTLTQLQRLFQSATEQKVLNASFLHNVLYLRLYVCTERHHIVTCMHMHVHRHAS